jgi:hypothetical protein
MNGSLYPQFMKPGPSCLRDILAISRSKILADCADQQSDPLSKKRGVSNCLETPHSFKADSRRDYWGYASQCS